VKKRQKNLPLFEIFFVFHLTFEKNTDYMGESIDQ